MADNTALKNRIRSLIKTNGNQEITGAVAQQILLDIVDNIDVCDNALLYSEQNLTDAEKEQAKKNIDLGEGNIIPIDAGVNLYNGKFTDAVGYDLNGNLLADPAWANKYVLSDKIYFRGHSQIYCNHCAVSFGYVIFDKNGNKLSSGLITSEEQVFSNVTGGEYIQFELISIDYYNTPIVICYGSSRPDEYEPSSELDTYIGGYKKTHIIYANSQSGTDDATHFYGNLAIRKAIKSIHDESKDNVYIIKASGTFTATVPSDYEYNIFYYHYAMFWLRPYIYLEGMGECKIYGTLPDTVVECQADTPGFVQSDYSIYQNAFILYGCNISNITFICKNIRYPLHIDGGTNYFAKNSEFVCKNCKFIHLGKHGDAIGTIGGSASGFGTSSGSKYIFDTCLFKTTNKGLYVHDNSDFTSKSEVIWKNCELVLEDADALDLELFFMNNPIGSDIYVENLKSRKLGRLYCGVDLSSTIAERIDHYTNHNIVINKDPIATFIQIRGYGLRIQGGESIRFDQTSTAFNAIIGYSDESIPVEFNRYGLSEVYGYCYRDGNEYVPAMAVGLRNIEGSDYSLGKRLGNCSSVNKVLNIIIDGITYTITFNRNYNNVSDEDILAEINSVISSAATVDLFNLSSYIYPQFNNTGVEVVDDDYVLSGMGVVFTSGGGIARASNKVDAIVLDDGISGGKVRVIYKGFIAYDPNNSFKIRLVNGANPYAISEGTQLGISSNSAYKGCWGIGAPINNTYLIGHSVHKGCEIVKPLN